MHELVLRGVTIADSPTIEAWATSPHWRHHPLAWLPLELFAIEEAPTLPSYSVGGGSYAMPYGPLDGPEVTLGSVTHLPQVTDTTTEEFSEAAAAAVANWAEESNGRSEAGTYDLVDPVETEALPGLLMTLGLECLNGVGPRKRLALSSCRPEHAWRMLFGRHRPSARITTATTGCRHEVVRARGVGYRAGLSRPGARRIAVLAATDTD